MKNILILVFLLFISNYTFSQNEKTHILQQMKEDISYLASDKLKGRQTGTNGEKRAAKYISKKFEENNLIEKGNKGYFQYFKTTINKYSILWFF